MKDTEKYTADLLRGRVSVKSLIHDLKSLNGLVKWSGGCGLRAVGNKSAFEQLVKALNDKDPNVRVAAARGLGWMRDKKAVEPLIERLKDDDHEVRLAAIKALGDIGDKKATPPLRQLFENEFEKENIDATIFIAALKSLADIYIQTYS